MSDSNTTFDPSSLLDRVSRVFPSSCEAFNHFECATWNTIGIVLPFWFRRSPVEKRPIIIRAAVTFVVFGVSDYFEAPTHGLVPAWLWVWKILCGASLLWCRHDYIGPEQFRWLDRTNILGLVLFLTVLLVMAVHYCFPDLFTNSPNAPRPHLPRIDRPSEPDHRARSRASTHSAIFVVVVPRLAGSQCHLNPPITMHHGDITPDIAAGLLALKKRIDAAKIPPSKLDETINVAVWNIREFGKVERRRASLHYIAEILGQFDLVALVELRDNLCDLAKVLPILGPSWQVVYSDWIEDAGGNRERTGFLYDRRAVTFNGLAAEVDPPREKKATEYLAKQSFWRAPYLCSFRSGNFDFLAMATHTRWGDSIKGRQSELQMLADWIKKRFESKAVEDTDLIVMGDFNIPKISDSLFNALTSRGLQIPDVLKNLKVGDQAIAGSNLGKDARYDQILHLPTVAKRFSNKGGAVDFHISDARIKELFPNEKLSRDEFTFQLSDHFPVWVQIKTDIDGERLNQIVQAGRQLGKSGVRT